MTPAVLQTTGRNQEDQGEENSFLFFLLQLDGGLVLFPGKKNVGEVDEGVGKKSKDGMSFLLDRKSME